MVKNLPAMQETRVQSLGWDDPLEEGMETHSSILTWRIPFTEAVICQWDFDRGIQWLYHMLHPLGKKKIMLVTQSCPTLCDPMDYSKPGSSIDEISQARLLERVAISFSRGSSQPRD